MHKFYIPNSSKLANFQNTQKKNSVKLKIKMVDKINLNI